MKTIKLKTEDDKTVDVNIEEDGTMKIVENKGRWIPAVGQLYWYLYSAYYLENERWADFERDIVRFAENNVFETKEIAVKVSEYKKRRMELSRPFKYEEMNYYMCYSFYRKKILIEWENTRKINEWYFESEEDIETLINEFGEDFIKKYILGVYGDKE